MSSSPNKRRDRDVMQLITKDHKVAMGGNDMSVIIVDFHGPAGSLYEGGVWKVRVQLLDDYPHQSPSISFVNKIYHPNIEERSGAVCLNAINESWSPSFDLVEVFEVFLPQLLLNPNPDDPLNLEAGGIMICNKSLYDEKVKEYCQRYAKPEDNSPPKGESTDEQPGKYDNASSDEQPGGSDSGPSDEKVVGTLTRSN